MTTKEFSIAVMAFVEAFHSNTQKEPSVARNDGGPGSGNFNHKGVEGQLGGSAPSGGGKYGGLSNEAKSIVKENVSNPYHIGESYEQKRATTTKLAGELKKAGIRVDYNEEHDTYSAMSTDLSYEENMDVCKALNQSYYSFAGYDRKDYVDACRKEGKEPKLHETPKKLDEGFFYSKSGKLQTDGTPVFARLDKEAVLSNGDLVRYSGLDRDINPDGFEKHEKATEEAIDVMTDGQRAALHEYTQQFSSANYSAVNRFLTTGEGSERVQKNAEEIKGALDHEIGVECVTSRGDSVFHGTGNDDKVNKLVAQIEKGNFSNAGKLEKMLKGQVITNEAAMSTSPNDATSGYGSLPVQYIFKTPADAKAVDITGLSAYGGGRSEAEKALANSGLFGTATYEREVLYRPGTKFKVDDVKFSCTSEGKKKHGQVYVICSILTGQNDSNTDGMPYRQDEDPASWITLENGQHVPLNESGYAIGGAGGWAAGKDFSTAKSQKRAPKYKRSEAQDKALKKIAKKTANLKKEQMRIVDKDGNVLLEKKGDKGSVSATVGEKRELLGGNVSIHNHPDGGTFSAADLSDFGFGATEMVVSTPEGTYTLTNEKYGTPDQSKGWLDMRDALEKEVPSDMSAFQLLKQARENLKDSHEIKEMNRISEAWVKLKDSGASQEELNGYYRNSGYEDLNKAYKAKVEKEQRRLEVQPSHDFFEKNASKYGFKYTFEPTGRKDGSTESIGRKPMFSYARLSYLFGIQ